MREKTENALIYLLILCAGIAIGTSTPQSWYASGVGEPAHTTQASLAR